MRVDMRQGRATSTSATATPNAAEINNRACSVHSRPSSFNSRSLRRLDFDPFDLDFAKGRSHSFPSRPRAQRVVGRGTGGLRPPCVLKRRRCETSAMGGGTLLVRPPLRLISLT